MYTALLECLEKPESEDLELYMFRASPDKFVEIRVDKVLYRDTHALIQLFMQTPCFLLGCNRAVAGAVDQQVWLPVYG